jgi:hypothetical protein
MVKFTLHSLTPLLLPLSKMSTNTSAIALGLCDEIFSLFGLDTHEKIDNIDIKSVDLKSIETWFNSNYRILSHLSRLSLDPIELNHKDHNIESKVRGVCTVARICLLKLCTKLVIGLDTPFPENNVLEGIYDKDSHGVPTSWKLYVDNVNVSSPLSELDYKGEKYMYVYELYDKSDKSSQIFREANHNQAKSIRDGNQYVLLTDEKIEYNIDDNDSYGGLVHFVDFSRLTTDTY